eukprot:1159778-Rhodomonas_salina.2
MSYTISARLRHDGAVYCLASCGLTPLLLYSTRTRPSPALHPLSSAHAALAASPGSVRACFADLLPPSVPSSPAPCDTLRPTVPAQGRCCWRGRPRR